MRVHCAVCGVSVVPLAVVGLSGHSSGGECVLLAASLERRPTFAVLTVLSVAWKQRQDIATRQVPAARSPEARVQRIGCTDAGLRALCSACRHAGWRRGNHTRAPPSRRLLQRHLASRPRISGDRGDPHRCVGGAFGPRRVALRCHSSPRTSASRRPGATCGRCGRGWGWLQAAQERAARGRPRGRRGGAGGNGCGPVQRQAGPLVGSVPPLCPVEAEVMVVFAVRAPTAMLHSVCCVLAAPPTRIASGGCCHTPSPGRSHAGAAAAARPHRLCNRAA